MGLRTLQVRRYGLVRIDRSFPVPSAPSEQPHLLEHTFDPWPLLSARELVDVDSSSSSGDETLNAILLWRSSLSPSVTEEAAVDALHQELFPAGIGQ